MCCFYLAITKRAVKCGREKASKVKPLRNIALLTLKHIFFDFFITVKLIFQPLFTSCVEDANFGECPICKEKITWTKDVVVAEVVEKQ